MQSPPYLLDQYARSRGLTPNMAKRAMMLEGYAVEGQTLDHSCRMLGIAAESAKRLCRKLLIDFPDYRPYARLEAKGEPRPDPVQPKADDACNLPLFGRA